MIEGIGKPVDRLDGRLKVTGGAKYAADWAAGAKPLHGVLVQSSIANGKIKEFNLQAAKKVSGVVEILTYENAPKLAKPKGDKGSGMGESFTPFSDNKIHYNGQYVALVLAETLEAAHEGASLVHVTYTEAKPVLDFITLQQSAHVLKDMEGLGPINAEIGNAKQALAKSEIRIDYTYTTPIENHNPIELSATIASFDNGSLLAYDATQGVHSASKLYAGALDVPQEKAHVITKFIGGGFGCKGSMWPHQLAALMATKKLGRPVKLMVTREQMFTGVGHRAFTIQHVQLGSDRHGTLQAIQHTCINNTAINKEYSERSAVPTPMLYKCENISAIHKVLPTNFQVPTFMRAPGECSGSFALESAMDELAIALKMDPIELRLKNYAEMDQHKKKPFSGKNLKACYEEGAKAFKWERRKSEPRSVRDGDYYIGYGMATATYPAQRFPAKAKIELLANGTANVSSATQDIGTGTWTVLPQIASQYLQLEIAKINFNLGDSRLVPAGVSGGSTTVSSVGSAIKLGCEKIKEELLKIAGKDKASPLNGAKLNDLEFKDGRLALKSDPKKSESFADLLQRNQLNSVTAIGEIEASDDESKRYSTHSFGAQFAEVRVHRLTGEVRVSKCLGAFACGEIINPKTARNQFMGGIIFGIGMALMEQTVPDFRTGRLVTKDLSDYHVPVQADVPDIEVLMIKDFDSHANPIGAKGIGEIGIVGAAAAIANAVYNAVGVRIRDLPILPEKIAMPLGKV